MSTYQAFLEAKARLAPALGFLVELDEINPLLKPHQKRIVQWACLGGRRAIFAAFGLGKSIVQLEIVRLVRARVGGRGLIVLPLGVRREFQVDAAFLRTGDRADVTDAQRAELAAWLSGRPDRIVTVEFIRSIDRAAGEGLFLTNYETVRDGRIDPADFTVVSFDEAACLRGFGGTKTFREFMRLFDSDAGGGRVPYRFVATATPSPNETIEILAYAAFLGAMDVGQAKTRFFKRDSEKADQLTLHPHKEQEFWLWVASWGLFVSKPSDLGFSDEGYELPELQVVYHEVKADLRGRAVERDGQHILIRDAAIGVQGAAAEKRSTLAARVDAMKKILSADRKAHAVIWHDLEDERRAIEKAVRGVVSVYGAQDLDDREAAIEKFSRGKTKYLAAKPVMLGSGCNLQRFCHTAVFLGIGFKFNDFIQAIHRLQRFLQPHPVSVHIIYAETEREILRTLQRKWRHHIEMVATMTEIVRRYGLNEAAMADVLARSIGCERIEKSGDGFRCVNADCVEEARRMEADSVDLIVSSLPFSTQYEYTPSYNDFGHTDDDAHFWAQMDFLTPELLRVIAPGRVAAIHVKDRVTPGGINGFGFQTLSPFSDDAVAHFRKHGFAFLGRKTITTDVVRENNQTYRLGWTEQCKDGSRMGVGVPEYLLLFRKPPTDRSNGYADKPVAKAKKEWLGNSHNEGWSNPDGYSRARWQIDAHGYTRSSGDRHLTADELNGLAADKVFKLWREFSLASVYDFEHHVAIGEHLEQQGCLPPTFMLLPPHSWHPDVWSDVTRMLTLNGAQSAKGKEGHLCPFQFDIVDRAIAQFSEPGETVFDPFGGLMTVPVRALRAGRKGIGIELNPGYFLDGCAYVEAEAQRVSTPSLFDLIEGEAA